MPIMQTPGGRGEQIGQEECDRINAILEEAQLSDELSDWEKEFCESLRSRLEEWGPSCFVSPKQMVVIEKIAAKYCE